MLGCKKAQLFTLVAYTSVKRSHITVLITNVFETIIYAYGAKPNSILVDVIEYDMRSSCVSCKTLENRIILF